MVTNAQYEYSLYTNGYNALEDDLEDDLEDGN